MNSMQVRINKTHLLNFWGQGLFCSACDLAHEFVELALAKYTVALALKLEWWELGDDRLAHGARSAVGRTAHRGARRTHADWHRLGNVQSPGNGHFGIVQLLTLATTRGMEVTLTTAGLHWSRGTWRLGV